MVLQKGGYGVILSYRKNYSVIEPVFHLENALTDGALVARPCAPVAHQQAEFFNSRSKVAKSYVRFATDFNLKSRLLSEYCRLTAFCRKIILFQKI